MGISEQLEIRKALVDEIEADLVGPRLGENEIIRINPQRSTRTAARFSNM